MRSNLRWCDFVNCGIIGSYIRDMMVEAVEKQFEALRTLETIEMLSDHIGTTSVQDRLNGRPRRVLHYHTSNETFTALVTLHSSKLHTLFRIKR